VLDKRTTIGKRLDDWAQEIIADLGGDVSAAQRQVIDMAVRTKLLVDSIDAWLLAQPAILSVRKRALFPVVQQRQQLADALVRYLGLLGLKRQARRFDLPSRAAARVPSPRPAAVPTGPGGDESP
jgi:hypothetical protein